MWGQGPGLGWGLVGQGSLEGVEDGSSAKRFPGSSGQCFPQVPRTASWAPTPLPTCLAPINTLPRSPGWVPFPKQLGSARATGCLVNPDLGPKPKAPHLQLVYVGLRDFLPLWSDRPRACGLRHCLVPVNPAWPALVAPASALLLSL